MSKKSDEPGVELFFFAMATLIIFLIAMGIKEAKHLKETRGTRSAISQIPAVVR